MTIFERIKNKASQALQTAGNFVDRDQSMSGVQLAQGGLSNRVQNVAANIGRTLQKAPDTTFNYQQPDRQLFGVGGPQGFNAVPFLTSLPGEMVRSYGKTLERISTPQGRQEIGQGTKDLFTQVPSLDTLNNPAVQTAFDVTDFLPGAGLFFGGLKSVAKEGAEKVVREGAEMIARDGAETIANNVIQKPPRGLITRTENEIDNILGTDSFMFGNSWRNRLPARGTALDQLQSYADTGDVLPNNTLNLVNNRMDLLDRVRSGDLFNIDGNILPNGEVLPPPKPAVPEEVINSLPLRDILDSSKPTILSGDPAIKLPKRPSDTMYVTPQGTTFKVNKQPKTTQSFDSVLDDASQAINPADKTIVETTQKALPSGDIPLGLPVGQRSVTIAQLKKIKESGSNFEGVNFVAKNADEAREAIKLGLPNNQISVNPKNTNSSTPLFDANGDIMKSLPDNQEAFDFAREASKEDLNTGNKFTRWVRNMFQDTEDNLKTTFGNAYRNIEPAMETFKTRVNDGVKWAKGYEDKLVELTNTVKAGSEDDKLLRLFGEKDGIEKVIKAVGQERASQLNQVYSSLRNMYDEMFNFIDTQRTSNGLESLPYKDDFLSQVGGSKGNMFESFIEGSPRTVDAKSSAIFKKQGETATTGAIESMRDYLEYAQRAGFTDLSGKDFTDFADYLSKQKGVNTEAISQLRTVADNILGTKVVNPILKGIETITGKMAGAKVIGKASTIVSQSLSLPQAIGRDPIAFVSGNIKALTKAYGELRSQSRVLGVVSKSTPSQLRTGNAFTKAVGYSGDVLVKGQKIANDLIFNGFLDRAKKMGLADTEAVKWADEQLVKIVGDRRLGMSPQAYNTFIGKIFGRFTLEPTTAITRLVKDVGEKKFGAALGTLVAWHIGNKVNQKYGTGVEPLPDPYEAVKDSVEYWNGSDTKEQSKLKAVTRLISESLQTMPIIQNMFNTAYSGAELMGATASEDVFGQDDSTWMNSGSLYNPLNKWDRSITGNKVVDVPWNIAANTLPFFEQGARTTQAAATQARGYAETKNGAPMYKAPEGVDAGRSLLFGQSSTENARDFFNNDFTGWLSDKQKAALDRIDTKEGKLNFLQNVQNSNEKVNQLKSKTSSIGTISKPTTSAEKKATRDYVVTSLEGGETPRYEDISQGLFNGLRGDNKSIEIRTKVYSELKTQMSNEFFGDEQKQAILEASGIEKDSFDYYSLASKDADVRLQELLPKLDNMDSGKVVEFLMQGRKAIAGKQLVSSEMVDYLFENDYIGQNEKEAIKALKFDEIKNEFYFSKSFAKKGTGMTYKQAKALYKMDMPKFSTLKNTSSLLGSYNNASQTRGGNDKLISNILNSPKKQKNGKLWF